MHRLVPAALRLVIVVFACFPINEGEAEPLFDGKTLNGWEGDTENTWRIERGAIVGGFLDKFVPRNEFLCTAQTYSDFELKVRFKLLGNRKEANAGIQFRTRRIPQHHEVVGYQADIGQHYWGALYDKIAPGPHSRPSPPKSDIDKLVKHASWNNYVILCEGSRVRLWLNGTLTVDYTEPDANIERAGIVCLQIHGDAKAKVYYKDIIIEKLTRSN